MQNIDTVFEHIFLKNKNKNTNENEEKVDIYNEIKNLTSNEFDNMLDEIKNEYNENKNTDLKNNNQLKEEFCQSFKGFGDGYYQYKIESSLSSIENDYQLIYNDFLHINNQLIDNKLKDLLLKHSNNKRDVDSLYNKIIKRRNACCVFPFKHCSVQWDDYGSDYISLINQFNKNKNDTLKMFCILYNCMISIFVGTDDGDGGLDEYIYKYNENSDDLCDLCDLCERYILVSMIKSDIFGYDGKLVKNHENDYGKKDVYSSDIVSFIIKNVFDNDLTSFRKLLKYCVQDLKYNSDISKLKDIYKLNGASYYGIAFYVLNRLSYVLYHDLLCFNTKKENNLLFPSMKQFYQFLYDFGVYCHCHTHHGVKHDAKDAKKQKEYQGLFDRLCV